MIKIVKQKGLQTLDVIKLKALAEQLRFAGLRPTRQRVAIATILLDGRHRHVTADSLAVEITDAGLQVSVGTVYNTLNQFTDAGLLRRVIVHNNYSLFDTNTECHHHFYEGKTNELVDVPNGDVILTKLPNPPNGYEIEAVDVVIHIQKK
jgi:Fur family iron response transcriptional regulator